MSLAIAIQTKEGIIVASDSRGTFGDPRRVTGANDTIQKVYGLTKYTAMAIAGANEIGATLLDLLTPVIQKQNLEGIDNILQATRQLFITRYNEWFPRLPAMPPPQAPHLQRPGLVVILAGYRMDNGKMTLLGQESMEICNISPQESSEELRNNVNKELMNYISKDGFDPKTSARLKINFTGEMTFEKLWQINDLMVKLRRDCFSQTDKYNILQLIWQVSDISETIEDDISPGIIEDYILEKPDEEFNNFVKEKLTEDKTQFNVEKLTQFGLSAIKSALRIMDKEEEV